MFEDIERNLIVPHQRGMKTVLIVPEAGQPDHREPFEIPGTLALPHVDFVTTDLGGFLADLTAARGA